MPWHTPALVIQLGNISKRYGKQFLLVEASASINRGEKVGLVGPNGAGKTTIFRLITGEEEADDGQVSVERNVRAGYFSQDDGDMKGSRCWPRRSTARGRCPSWRPS